MFAVHLNAGTGAPAALPLNGVAGLRGLTVASAEAATWYLKLWFQVQNASAPTVGTTPPSITIPVPVGGITPVCWPQPIANGGPVYWWATKNAGDSDSTALLAGGDVITLFCE